jgi:hypothetical protein
VQVKE